MKIQKLSLKSIKNVLSRTEMKEIMAGSGGGTGGGGSGGGGCPIPCAPNCNTSVLIYCYGSGGTYQGQVLGYTCNHEGQIQACISGGYGRTLSTQSDCQVGCIG